MYKWTTLALTALLLMGVVWDAAWESRPTGTDLASDLDLFIQETKQEISNRMEVEAHFGTLTTTNDNGLMFLGSSRCFVQNGAPTALGNVGGWDGNAHVATTLTVTEPNGSADQGAGRCWVDLDGPDNTAGTPDDMSVAFWNETLNDFVYQGVVDITASLANQRFLFDPGKYNLVYNGSFEAADGTGLAASTTVPDGWALSTTPTIAYASPPVSEGEGLEVIITAGGSDEGIEQTLTSLKASTTYYAVARAQPATGGDVCTLFTTGAGTDMTDAVSTGTAYVTLSGAFVTDATPTAVVLDLQADDGDVCSFDHVAVYETSSDRRGLTQPGAYKTSGAGSGANVPCTNVGSYAAPCDDLAQTTVEISGPGTVVLITATAVFDSTQNDQCVYRLHDETNDTTLVENTQSATSLNLRPSVTLTTFLVNPVPGTLVLDLDAQSTPGSGDCDYRGDLSPASIEALVLPVR
jgi:hypothetical protein